MIRNPRLLEALEKDLVRQETADYPQNMRIFEALYLQAKALGVLPLKDPLEDIETDLCIARVLPARKAV